LVKVLQHDKRFWAFLVLEIILIFLLDYSHEVEQTVYQGEHLASAENLWRTGSYLLHGEMAFHPIWGYPILILLCGFSSTILLIFQGILCWTSILYFYSAISIRPSSYHLAIFLPFIALCSIKWPNAITAMLILFYIGSYSSYLTEPTMRKLLTGAFAGGLAILMRGEAWVWGPAIFISLLFPMALEFRRRGIKFGVTVIIIQLLFISPWTLRAFNHTGVPMLTPSYGGLVALISLGQYPNNPWGVEPLDSYAQKFVAEKGISSTISPKANQAMKDEFYRLISAEPLAFVKKVAYNFRNIFKHGLFTGQFFTLTITEADYWRALNSIKRDGLLSFIKDTPLKVALPMLLHLSLDYIFRVGWVFLLGVTFLSAFLTIKRNEPLPPSVSLSIVFTLVMFAIVSLLQYQPRHVTLLWLPVLYLS